MSNYITRSVSAYVKEDFLDHLKFIGTAAVVVVGGVIAAIGSMARDGYNESMNNNDSITPNNPGNVSGGATMNNSPSQRSNPSRVKTFHGMVTGPGVAGMREVQANSHWEAKGLLESLYPSPKYKVNAVNEKSN